MKKRPTEILLLLLVLGVIGVLAFKDQSVSSSSDKVAQDYAIEVCHNTVERKDSCWEVLLDKTLKQQGLSQAFSLLSQLSHTEPQFALNCHAFTHQLGEGAYLLYSEHKNFTLDDKSTYCGFGFYHGLMEEIMRRQSFKEAGAFCDGVKKTYPVSISDACYHGIGHGAFSISAPSYFGDEEKSIQKALSICKSIADDTTTYSRCASGVFMELGNSLMAQEYGLKIDPLNPLTICQTQEEPVKIDCYTQLNGVLAYISSGDFAKGAAAISKIPDDYYATEAIETYASTMLDPNNTNYQDDVEECRGLQDRLKASCFKGLALGFMLKGSPGHEYQQAINLCKSPLLQQEEKEACFGLVLRQSALTYSQTINKQVCRLIDQSYWGQYCKG